MVTHDPKAAEYARHTLTDIGALDAFKARLANDPRLKVEVQTTRDYFGRQSAAFTRIIRILGTTVGAIMAFGALFGVLNTMYSAVAARAREIATLRAIGFRRVPMIVSILLETMLLARGAPSVPRPRGQSSTASSPQPSARIPARWCSPSESRRLERPQVGTCDRSHRRVTPRGPSSTHADFRRLARALTIRMGTWFEPRPKLRKVCKLSWQRLFLTFRDITTCYVKE